MAQPFDICRRSEVVTKPIRGDNEKGKRPAVEGQTSAAFIHRLRPGMVLIKGFLKPEDQIDMVRKCRQLGVGVGGFYRPTFKNGAKMKLWMMCLGKNWDPSTCAYSPTRPFDGARSPDIPEKFNEFVQSAIATVGEIPPLSPDICVVNFYDSHGKLGLHQDKDESSKSLRQGLPVISFSLGDTAEFLYGDSRDKEKASKVSLESGDVLIFGGQSRLLFHGISQLKPHSAPKWLTEEASLCPGRLNLTFRKY